MATALPTPGGGGRQRMPALGPLWRAAWFALACAGCQSKATPGGNADPPRVVPASKPATEPGQEASTPHFAMSVKNARMCAVEAHLAPPPGVKKFAVEVVIRSLGDQQVPVNPFYATLTTTEGDQYESTLAGCRPQLAAQRLGPNDSSRGWITFDIPETARPTALVYRPVMIGVGTEKVELLLGP